MRDDDALRERETDEYRDLLAATMLQAACWGSDWDDQDAPTRDHWRQAAQSVMHKVGSPSPEQATLTRGDVTRMIHEESAEIRATARAETLADMERKDREIIRLRKALTSMCDLVDNLFDAVPWGQTNGRLNIKLLNDAPIAARAALAHTEPGEET